MTKMSDAQLYLQLELGDSRRNHPAAVTTCIYCGGKADTRDHVPPKALLLEPWPPNLRTVPACSPCNSAWSLDEQYLAIIVAHLTENPRVMATLDPGGAVDRALAAAPLLDDRIIASLFVEDDGRAALAPEIGRMGRIAEKVAHGLHVLRYGTGPQLRDFTIWRILGPGDELPPNLAATQWNWPGIRRKRWTTVQRGIFSFIFARGWMVEDPPLYCLINLADTLLMAIACPAPIGKPEYKRVRSKPWP